MCSSVPPNSRICPRGSRVPRHAAPTEYFEVREMSSRYTKTCRWCQATYALERAKKRLRVLEGSTAPTRRSRCKRKPPIRGLRSRILRRISAHVAALEGRGWSRSNGSILEYCSLPNRNKAEEFLSSLKQDWIQAGPEVVLDRRVPSHVFDPTNPRHRRAQMHHTNLRILPSVGSTNVRKTSLEQSSIQRENRRFQDVVGWVFRESIWMGFSTGWAEVLP